MKKKKNSTDEIIKNIFDPVQNSGTETPPQQEIKEQTVFFQKEDQLVEEAIQEKLAEAPVETIRKPAAVPFSWFFYGLAFVIAAHAVLSYFEHKTALENAQSLVETREKQRALLNGKLAELKKEDARIRGLAQSRYRRREYLSRGMAFVTEGQRKEGRELEVLSAIARLRSEGIWFGGVSTAGRHVSIQAYALDIVRASKFMKLLRESPLFINERMHTLTSLTNETFAFQSFEVDLDVTG